MNSNKMENARKIFEDNHGNHDLMKENNTYLEYKSYEVLKGVEDKWREEYMGNIFDSVDSDLNPVRDLTNNLCELLEIFVDKEGFTELADCDLDSEDKLSLLELLFYYKKLTDTFSGICYTCISSPKSEKLELVKSIKINLKYLLDYNEQIKNSFYEGVADNCKVKKRDVHINSEFLNLYNRISELEMFLINFA